MTEEKLSTSFEDFNYVESRKDTIEYFSVKLQTNTAIIKAVSQKESFVQYPNSNVIIGKVKSNSSSKKDFSKILSEAVKRINKNACPLCKTVL